MPDIPTFNMDASSLLKDDIDMYLSTNYDLFFRRIYEHINNRIDNIETDDLLCWIQDEENLLYELRLPRSGFKKAINKSLEYFKMIEEYETCQLINELKKEI